MSSLACVDSVQVDKLCCAIAEYVLLPLFNRRTVALGELAEEGPDFFRCEALSSNIVSCISWKRDVVSIEGSPLGWVFASIVYGLDALAAVGRWVGCVLGLASI